MNSLFQSMPETSSIISGKIPKYSRIDSAIFSGWVKRGGTSGSSYNTDLKCFLAKDSYDKEVFTILSKSDWISTSYKQYVTNDFKDYFNSKNKNAGQRLTSWNRIYTYCNGTVARLYTVKDRVLEIGYTPPVVIISVSAETGGTATTSATSLNLEVPGQSYSATLTATPSTGYTFVKWSDGDTNPTRTITYSDNSISAFETNASYTAIFQASKKIEIIEAFMLKNDNEIISASSPIITGQGFILKVKAEIE